MTRKTTIPSLIAARVSNLRRPPGSADPAPPAADNVPVPDAADDIAAENRRAAERAAADAAFTEATGALSRLDVLRETANQHSLLRKST